MKLKHMNGGSSLLPVFCIDSENLLLARH